MYHINKKTNELLNICINNFNQNNLSKDYGSFDRSYWNYRTIDFSSGMSQTNFYAFALAYKVKFMGNIFYKNEKVKKWILAGIQNTIKITNKNGSLDDYFPYEQAVGATTFTFISLIKTIELLSLNKQKYKTYIKKCAKFIAFSNESGIISNHKAAEILSLTMYRKLFSDNSFIKQEKYKISQLIQNYNQEGWFEEYGGCDLGYHTVTLSRLMDIYELTKSKKILNYCKNMTKFSINFLNPDFTYGGHYSSRGTSICFIDGFAKISKFSKEAYIFVDSINNQIRKNILPLYNDDKTSIHHCISYLETIKLLKNKKIKFKKKYNVTNIISKEGISRIKKNKFNLIFSIKKGGSFKLFKGNKLIDQDSSILLKYKNNYYLSCFQNDLVDINCDKNFIEIKKFFSKFKEQRMNSFKLILLRLLMNTFGKFIPNIVRKIMQKILVYNNSHVEDLYLKRKIFFYKSSIKIEDKISKKVDYFKIQKPINPSHVVMSNVFKYSDIQEFNKKKYTKTNNSLIRSYS